MVALTGLVVACGTGEERIFTEVVSPDGGWTLRVTVKKARMPQGPFFVTVYLVPATSSVAVKVFTTTLANDGVPFTHNEIAPRWTSTATALLCLRASDRPDQGLRIDVAPQPRAVEVAQC